MFVNLRDNAVDASRQQLCEAQRIATEFRARNFSKQRTRPTITNSKHKHQAWPPLRGSTPAAQQKAALKWARTQNHTHHLAFSQV
jgi:hypothetical protein